MNTVCLSSGEKENSLKTDDYGRDLSSVQTLLTKQVHTGLVHTGHMFELELNGNTFNI